MTDTDLDSEATPSGAEEGTEKRAKPQRDIDADAIGARRLRELELESGVDLDAENLDSGQIQEQLEEDATPKNASDKVPIEGSMVRIKVDGQEREVPFSDLVRQYQVNSAADLRLEEATRLLQDARAQAERLSPISRPEAVEQTSNDTGHADLRTSVQEAISLMYSGDDAAAAERLARVIESARAPAAPAIPDVNALVPVLVPVLDEVSAVRRAMDDLKTEYPDLFANRDLDRLTFLKVQDLEATGVSRSDAMRQAAAEVYASLGKIPASQEPPAHATQTSRDKKMAEKEARDRIPIAHVAASDDNSQPRTQTASSIIAEIAARRLGQSLIR